MKERSKEAESQRGRDKKRCTSSLAFLASRASGIPSPTRGPIERSVMRECVAESVEADGCWKEKRKSGKKGKRADPRLIRT
jgi:hypothetical protein